MKSNSCVYSLEQLESAVDCVIALYKKSSVLTFTGSLGAGKTTLIQAVFERLGVQGPIQSPTFTYVNEYKAADGTMLYHFDLYRLQTLQDFLVAGFDEYLYKPNSKCFIEWPGIIEPLLTHDMCHIELDYEGLEMRRLSYNCSIGQKEN